MDPDDQWMRQQAGIGCYLCQPQLSQKKGIRLIASLSISDLYLVPDQRFLGNSTLIFNAGHATRLDLLTDDEYAKFTGDLRLGVRAIRKAFRPDHMNVALMGNSCPHLHWGIAPRYRNDPCWGRPIWAETANRLPVALPTLTDEGYVQLIAKIRTELESRSFPVG